MVMSGIWTIMVAMSVFCAVLTGRGTALAAATVEGAQAGVTVAMALAGSLCLWSGVGNLLEQCGATHFLAKIMRPMLDRIFPRSRGHEKLAGYLSANVCANFLGLGNAATPMGIRAAREMAQGDAASDELCRLIVLNTASIQLIPANVAAVRSSLGCATPFDILPAVWITSVSSAGLGLLAAWFLGKVTAR